MMRFEKYIRENYTMEELKDIAQHGCVVGFPGLTYYIDTVRLYEEYEDDIWDLLEDDTEGLGYDNPLQLIASFNGAEHVWTDTQFKNLLVWYYVEQTAFRITEGIEDSNYV